MEAINEIFFSDKILYQCSCLLRKSITQIYFCRYCLKLRCKDCVYHEVDSQYCMHCLEYIPIIDTKQKKYMCASCFLCPYCKNTLTSRTFMIRLPSDSDSSQMIEKKAQYLVCSYCKWSSKDVGIPDLVMGSGGWPEMEVPNRKRIEELFDHYRFVAQKERMEKEKKRINPKAVSAIHLLDKYRITASLSAKVSESLRSKFYSGRMTSSYINPSKSLNETKLEPSVATDETEPLPDDFISQPVNEDEVSSLSQRLMQIETQPTHVSNFYPVSRMLYVKRSLRCKECDHNLSKPEFTTNSIKFKIQLSAFYSIPEIKIASLPKFEFNKPAKVELTVKNPCQYDMHFSLIPLEPAEVEDDVTAEVVLPKTEFLLKGKDDTLDLDVELADKDKHGDSSKGYTLRGTNKIEIMIKVIPRKETGVCRVSFKIKYDFINSVIQMQSGGEKESQISWISHKMFLTFGHVVN